MDSLPEEVLEVVPIEVEVGKGFYVPIHEKMDGFGISYEDISEYYDYENGRLCYPNVKPLVYEAKDVMNELDIQQPKYFLLLLFRIIPITREPFSVVGIEKEKFYVGFPIKRTADKVQIKCKHYLYHELMHIKDVVDGRFPSIGRGSKNIALINFLWGFSIEGRLERMKKPHLEQDKAIKLYKNRELSGSVSKNQAKELCEELWGKEVTYEEIKSIAKKLMRVCR